MPVTTTARATVCLITDSFEPSGVGRHMLMLAESLLPDHNVLFVACSTPEGRPLLMAAAAAGCVPLRLPRSLWRRRPFLERMLAEHGVDLVHVHAGVGWEGHGPARVARAAGVPVVRTEHLPYLLRAPRQVREHLTEVSLLDALICVSEGNASTYVDAGVPASLIRVVRNGVTPRPALRSRAETRERLQIPAGSPLVVSVARATRQKDYPHLLLALSHVVPRVPEARFVFVGTGARVQQVHAGIRLLGLEQHARMLPTWDDVPGLLAAADLVTLASIFEGLPLVVLEAMAAGTPVVATRVLGTEEAVEHEVTGLLAPRRDVRGLAAAIVRALSEPERAAYWGEAGRQRWQREFTAERMVRETSALYEQVLERAGRRAVA